MNAGVQPLDALMEMHALKNHDLVAAAPEMFLTHKEVAKARKGRQLTAHTQRRILTALNAEVVTQASDEATKLRRIHIGVLLVMACNNYLIQK